MNDDDDDVSKGCSAYPRSCKNLVVIADEFAIGTVRSLLTCLRSAGWIAAREC